MDREDLDAFVERELAKQAAAEWVETWIATMRADVIAKARQD